MKMTFDAITGYIFKVSGLKTLWRKKSSPVVVALILSLLLHQLLIALLAELWPVPELEPKKQEKILLVESPPEIKPETKPEVQATPKIKSPKPRPKRAEKVAIAPPKAPAPMPLVGPPAPMPPAGPPAPRVAESEARPRAKEPPNGDINLNLDWRTFERTFAKQAKEEREAYAEAKLIERRKRGGFGHLSGKVRKALVTNRGWVKPGNQEPLGDRQRVFHNYIEQIHEQFIHPIFGESFWESLSSFVPDHPLNNWNLHTVAEFEIFANGKISEVRVVKTSGNAVFDAAAVDSIYRSGQFPAPPKAVLSWNNRVYLRWGFYRSERMCGVFNVEPYILRAPDTQKEKISIDEFLQDDG